MATLVISGPIPSPGRMVSLQLRGRDGDADDDESALTRGFRMEQVFLWMLLEKKKKEEEEEEEGE